MSMKLEGAGRTEIKGVLYLQAMSLRFSTYWNDQKTSASRVNLKSPTELVERIMSTDETWVPNLSAALRTALNISALTRMAGGERHQHPRHLPPGTTRQSPPWG